MTKRPEGERGSDGADPGTKRAAVTVTEALNGERLDKALAQLVPELSRTRARKVIGMGGVLVAGRRCRVSSRPVRQGDTLSAAWKDELKAAPEYPLHVAHEDEDLVILNKPAGQHTQGTALGDVGTLVYAVQRRFGPNARVIHRLDAPASGLIAVGLNGPTVAKLSEALRDHQVERLYLAATSGDPAEGACVEPLKRSGRRSEVVAPGTPDSQTAHTDFKRLATRTAGSLVEARLHTGRTHQVRVHLAHLGAPIIGDRLYGGERAPRLCLHAWRISLAHPHTGAHLSVQQDPSAEYWEAAAWSPLPTLPEGGENTP